MDYGQRTHLVSTLTTALQYLADVREVALTGKGADGTIYTPLPQPQRDELVALVDQISAVLSRTLERTAPERSRALRARKSLGATRMWLSTLLYMVQEQVEDIHPGRMSRRYGAVPDDLAADLAGDVDESVSLVRRALDDL
jgi:hypothetical protein